MLQLNELKEDKVYRQHTCPFVFLCKNIETWEGEDLQVKGLIIDLITKKSILATFTSLTLTEPPPVFIECPLFPAEERDILITDKGATFCLEYLDGDSQKRTLGSDCGNYTWHEGSWKVRPGTKTGKVIGIFPTRILEE